MLEELAKLDSEWRKIATKICGNKDLADDMVQDMYIKMHRLQPKYWNKHYISYAIYHLFINHIKESKKTVYLEDILFTDTEDSEITKDRLRIIKVLDEVSIVDKQVLLATHEKSLREASKDLFMSHMTLHNKKKKAFEKLLNTNGIKEWKDERT